MDVEIIVELLNTQPDLSVVSLPGPDKQTIAHHAATYGNTRLLKALLENDHVDFDVLDAEMTPVFDCAKDKEISELMEPYLKKHKALKAAAEDCLTWFDEAGSWKSGRMFGGRPQPARNATVLPAMAPMKRSKRTGVGGSSASETDSVDSAAFTPSIRSTGSRSVTDSSAAVSSVDLPQEPSMVSSHAPDHPLLRHLRPVATDIPAIDVFISLIGALISLPAFGSLPQGRQEGLKEYLVGLTVNKYRDKLQHAFTKAVQKHVPGEPTEESILENLHVITMRNDGISEEDGPEPEPEPPHGSVQSLRQWLTELHVAECYDLLVQAGFDDVSSVLKSRLTNEGLHGLGVVKMVRRPPPAAGRSMVLCRCPCQLASLHFRSSLLPCRHIESVSCAP
jgi:hypothetical protein